MSRLLFFTVGTSIFHSASWDPAAGVPPDACHYGDLVHPERIYSPEARGACSRARAELESLLTAANAVDWARYLPDGLCRDGRHDANGALRFSAELASFLRLVEEEGDGVSARQVLLSYDRTFVFADPLADPKGEAGRSWIAAAHLGAYLNAIAGGSAAEVVRIPGLASVDREVLFGPHTGLPLLFERVVALKRRHEAVGLDLILTGGYKIYGLVLSRLLGHDELRVVASRLIYGHESGGNLLILRQADLSFDGKRVALAEVAPGLG